MSELLQEAVREALEVAWQPNPGSQCLFLQTAGQVFEVLLTGPRGTGKTTVLLADFAQEVGKGLGRAWRGILFRQTYPQLQDVINKSQELFFSIWEKDVEVFYTQSPNPMWRWATGETLLLRQYERENDYLSYHGHAYPWIGWEELTNWPDDKGFRKMMSTCRSGRKGVPLRVRATCNPSGPGHYWVKERYRLPGGMGQIITDSKDTKGNLEKPRLAINSLLHENKPLLAATPDYLSTIVAAATSEAELRAWIAGTWDLNLGGLFQDVWDARYNVVADFTIPRGWRIDRSYDHGESAPFCNLWWVESDGSDYVDENGERHPTIKGDLFLFREWYGGVQGKNNTGLGLLVPEITRGILEREQLYGIYGRVNAGPADSAIFTSSNGNSIGADFTKPVAVNGKTVPGIIWLPSDKRAGSIKSGLSQLRRMLKAAHPRKGVREYPGLFMTRHCVKAVKFITEAPRSEKDLDLLPDSYEDHLIDAVRYRIWSAVSEARGKRSAGLG